MNLNRDYRGAGCQSGSFIPSVGLILGFARIRHVISRADVGIRKVTDIPRRKHYLNGDSVNVRLRQFNLPLTVPNYYANVILEYALDKIRLSLRLS
jgi:hypothetical protein